MHMPTFWRVARSYVRPSIAAEAGDNRRNARRASEAHVRTSAKPLVSIVLPQKFCSPLCKKYNTYCTNEYILLGTRTCKHGTGRAFHGLRRADSSMTGARVSVPLRRPLLVLEAVD